MCKNDPVQEESWVSIAPLSRTGPPPFPHISPPGGEHYTNVKQNRTIVFASLGQKDQQHAVLSFLPALFPAMPAENFRLETPGNFKSCHYHTQVSFEDTCNQIAIALLCTCIFFPDHFQPSRNLETKNKLQNCILKSSDLIERVS